MQKKNTYMHLSAHTSTIYNSQDTETAQLPSTDNGRKKMWRMCIVSVCSAVSNFFATPETTAHQAPLSMESYRQEHWSG